MWRHAKDRIASFVMEFGGVSVIIAIVLIFFYLLYVVIPVFASPEAESLASYDLPAPLAGHTLHLAMEEQNVMGVRFTSEAQAVFFNVDSGAIVRTDTFLKLEKGVAITAFAVSDLAKNDIIVGLSDGTVLPVRATFRIHFEAQQKIIEPALEYPLGSEPIAVAKSAAISSVAFRIGEGMATILAATRDRSLYVVKMEQESSLFSDDDAAWQTTISNLENIGEVFTVLVNTDQRIAYVALVSGEVINIDISDSDQAQILNRVQMVKGAERLTSFRFLTGGISLLVGTSSGRISQWFPVRQESGPEQLTLIREFDALDEGVTRIVTEQRRKGFLVAGSDGRVSVYHSTANKLLLNEAVSNNPIRQMAVSPRANRFLVEDEWGKYFLWRIENEHPEISFAVLWGQVWYESYNQPEYIWQSSSASNDFEPKFSLVPLAFGTLKAAFYAMLFAVPMAIFGAIYTAYFMTSRMRSLVKPSIEIMAALPTVILGFLAGLWLAPVIEANLPGTFLFFLMMPPGVVFTAFLWHLIPEKWRNQVNEGWQGALLILPVLFFGWLSLTLGGPLEDMLFAGNAPQWLSQQLGWEFDQRNSLIIGIAMGIAVIPTIFSISEDAIFSVPKHLTLGSLALGATPWQTMVRVVILTASPGIFSAIMIGLGRAVGETMIVLMATGNTPVMDLSIFQGMRTLSANIAVEMPESEVDSTHYRILFLAALVLFIITFAFNTVAEIVRQRLRVKYSSL